MIPETAIPEPAQTSIPSYLIYETLNGKPLYRKGYRDVLANRKTPGEIMGCSDLQAIIVSTLYGYLYHNTDRKKYWVVTNEPGLHIRLGDNLSNDIAFYAKDTVTVKGKFFAVAPKVVVEVNIKIDFDPLSGSGLDYVYEKTQAMLDFGTERVIWVTTHSRKVLVATKGENWITQDWGTTIPVIDTMTLNINQLLIEEGVI